MIIHPQNCIEPQFQLICLTPKFTMKELLTFSPSSILFTSRTLQPMESYADTFDTKFESRFNCGHVIDPERQLKVCVVKKLKDGKKMLFNFKTKDDSDLKTQLGQYVLELVKATPKGMVIFFASYTAMSNFYQAWEHNGIIPKIRKIKVVCREMKNSKQFKYSFKTFKENCKKKGALFLAVCSGKLSEGIDFTDEMARMVIMIGVPFPPTQSPSVIRKKKYLDQRIKEATKEKQRRSRETAGHKSRTVINFT